MERDQELNNPDYCEHEFDYFEEAEDGTIYQICRYCEYEEEAEEIEE